MSWKMDLGVMTKRRAKWKKEWEAIEQCDRASWWRAG